MPMKRAYKPRPKEQRHASYLRWYAKHKELAKAQVKTYATANRAKVLENKRRYYQENKAQCLASATAWRLNHPEARHAIWTRYNRMQHIARRISQGKIKARIHGWVFAVTRQEVETAVQKQADKCAICGRSEWRKQHGTVQNLAIDHCHSTGRFRGLLCEACNKVLGFMNDDAGRLRIAANYLDRTIGPTAYDFDGHA